MVTIPQLFANDIAVCLNSDAFPAVAFRNSRIFDETCEKYADNITELGVLFLST